MRWNILILVILLPSLTQTSYADEPEELELIGKKFRTDAVGYDGKRHSETHEDCIQAKPGYVIEQSSIRAEVKQHDDDSARECTFRINKYSSYFDGIKEPQSVCLVGTVRSLGGVINRNKRGHLQCKMTYLQKPIIASSPTPIQPSGKNATATLALLPADIHMEREERSQIDIHVPLSALISRLPDETIPLAKVSNIRFTGFQNDSLEVQLAFNLETIGAKCSPKIWINFPAEKLKDFGRQIRRIDPRCKTSGVIAELADIPSMISAAMVDKSELTFVHPILEDTPFDEWREDDPEFGALMEEAWAQGRYCFWRGQPALCIRLAWPDKSTFDKLEASLLKTAPVSEGEFDKTDAQNKLQTLLEKARSSHQHTVGAVTYPSGFKKGGEVEDADMALFGGLLCRAGIQEGCSLIQKSQTKDGRHWRSPGRVNSEDLPTHSTFSGDQLKGLIHYYTVTNDRVRLEKFQNYLRSQRTSVPEKNNRLLEGYSSCTNREPNFTCFLSGSDWHQIKLLSEMSGLDWNLPLDLQQIQDSLSFDHYDLMWEALITNNGYRLHLIANTAWSIRTLQPGDLRVELLMNKIIKVLAAREPNNPFFQYLSLGPDKRVKRLLDDQCYRSPERQDFSDWTWQRAQSDKAWEESMVWDCVFMYQLLLHDPLPYVPSL